MATSEQLVQFSGYRRKADWVLNTIRGRFADLIVIRYSAVLNIKKLALDFARRRQLRFYTPRNL